MQHRFDALIFRIERLERLAALRVQRSGEVIQDNERAGDASMLAHDDRSDLRRDVQVTRPRIPRRSP